MGAVYTQLSISKRRKMERWRPPKVPVDAMARVLDWSESTIHREINVISGPLTLSLKTPGISAILPIAGAEAPPPEPIGAQLNWRLHARDAAQMEQEDGKRRCLCRQFGVKISLQPGAAIVGPRMGFMILGRGHDDELLDGPNHVLSDLYHRV